MAKLTVRDLNVRGQRVFVRVDYNVPLEEKDGRMVITDETRIQETLPTLRLLRQQGGRLILAAHLGRPKGRREPSMSLRPVADRLAELGERGAAALLGGFDHVGMKPAHVLAGVLGAGGENRHDAGNAKLGRLLDRLRIAQIGRASCRERV